MNWWVPGLAPHERTSLDARPEWVDLVEQAVAARPDDMPAPKEAEPLRTLVTVVRVRLVERVGRVGGVDVNAVAKRFAEELTARLAGIAARTLDARPQRLDDAEELFATYPVLARLLGETACFAVEAQTELLARLAADRAAVVDALLGGLDPGPVVAVEAGRGDPHRHGRSVSTVVFSDGRRVVYRPRDVTPHVRFAELVDWVNRVVPTAELRAVAVVAGHGYGWLEFVHNRQCEDGAARFCRRLGVLLALLHAVRAVDVHYQNVIADGDQPVLVDVETLFHPRLPTPRAADPAARALAASVYRTGLLPQFVIGTTGATDISALGGVRLPGGTDPADHTTALVTGFRHGYDAIMRDRAEFAELVTSWTGVETRVVVRPTSWYVRLLDETTRPALLRDARDRDRALAAAVAGRPAWAHLARHELAELWAGDVPLFLGRPDSTDIWTSEGQHDSFDRSGACDALATVAAMSEADRRDQEWIISATVAARRSPSHADGASAPQPIIGTVADPARLLAAACAIGDRIVARSIADRDRVNWLGLELVDERKWLVLPMGAGLANGFLGVALFLVQLTELSGIARYGQVARHAVDAVPPLFEILTTRPAMVTAIGRGGLHGLGGIAFALARIATLLADDEARDLARTAVELAAATEPESPGWANGTAGCLAAMTAVHAELALPAAARLATDCADRLAATVDSGVPLPAGFADGAAGIAWALRRCAPRLSGGARHSRAAAAATRTAAAALVAGEANRSGWCTGTAGLVLGGLADEAGPWLRALTDRPPLRDFSLCHGELGIVDALTATSGTEPVRRRRAELVLDTLARHGPRCGTPDGVPTSGLLTGLAGIGYGLLRLGFTDRVPSVLLLEPNPLEGRNDDQQN